MKTCPKCNKEWPEDFLVCPVCNVELLSPQDLSRTGIGDANAISGDVHVSDDHSAMNSNNISNSNNATNSYNTTNNTTIFEAAKSESERLKDNILTYRLKCKELYNNGLISDIGERQLRELQFNLNLADELVGPIKEEIRQFSKTRKKNISLDGKVVIRQTKSIFEQNIKDALLRQLTSLETLMQEYDDNSLKLVYFQMSSLLESGRYIVRFEDSAHDEYWEAYWAYVAFMLQNREKQACEALASLGRWHTMYPEQNDLILRMMGQIMCNESLDVIQSTRSILPPNYTPELQLIVDTIDELLTTNWENDSIHFRQTHAFFINTLFVNFVNTQKELGKKRIAEKKAEIEAKEKEEQERKHEEVIATQNAITAQANENAANANRDAELTHQQNLEIEQEIASKTLQTEQAAAEKATANAAVAKTEAEERRREWWRQNYPKVLSGVIILLTVVAAIIWVPKLCRHIADKKQLQIEQEQAKQRRIDEYNALIERCQMNIRQASDDQLEPLDSAVHQFVRLRKQQQELNQDIKPIADMGEELNAKANKLINTFEGLSQISEDNRELQLEKKEYVERLIKQVQ